MCLSSVWTSQTCRSSMGLHRNVGFQWVLLVPDGSPIRHVGLRCSMSRSPMGHQSGMSSPMGIRWVSDNYNIFVNFELDRNFSCSVQILFCNLGAKSILESLL